MEHKNDPELLSFLESPSGNVQNSQNDEFDACFQASSSPAQEKTSSAPAGDDLLKFPEGFSSATQMNISELSDKFLDTFTGKAGPHEDTLESLLKKTDVKSFGKSEMSEAFLSTLTPREILGLDEKASLEEVRSAYKKIVLKMHPDKNPDLSSTDSEMFRRITEAYDTLTRSE
mmetsp:Transcript_793/g.1344  ORF Transcript_793/g.1344 Transcript_793/m.1344 type:complete len:173 (-) Transcript_793:54-572(-)